MFWMYKNTVWLGDIMEASPKTCQKSGIVESDFLPLHNPYPDPTKIPQPQSKN